MIRNGIEKAVLIFYSKALIYWLFLIFDSEISVRIKIISVVPTEFLGFYLQKSAFYNYSDT